MIIGVYDRSVYDRMRPYLCRCGIVPVLPRRTLCVICDKPGEDERDELERATIDLANSFCEPQPRKATE